MTQTKSMQGKVALISGASRGVGAAAAAQLLRRGAKVVITARGEARLEKTRALLEKQGGQVVAVAGDVGKLADCKAMVDAALKHFGRLDILVNNAGVSMRGHFAELSLETCEQVVSTNLTGVIYLTRLAVPHILKAKGSIVFISSIAGLMGLPGASVYCATKGALTGLSDSMRLELGPRGVHCGVVYLGFTEHDPEKRILGADGSLVPPDRPAHHTQAFAAGLIVELIEKRKRRLVMTASGKIGAAVNRFSPALMEKAILTAQQSQWKIFKQFS